MRTSTTKSFIEHTSRFIAGTSRDIIRVKDLNVGNVYASWRNSIGVSSPSIAFDFSTGPIGIPADFYTLGTDMYIIIDKNVSQVPIFTQEAMCNNAIYGTREDTLYKAFIVNEGNHRLKVEVYMGVNYAGGIYMKYAIQNLNSYSIQIGDLKDNRLTDNKIKNNQLSIPVEGVGRLVYQPSFDNWSLYDYRMPVNSFEGFTPMTSEGAGSENDLDGTQYQSSEKLRDLVLKSSGKVLGPNESVMFEENYKNFTDDIEPNMPPTIPIPNKEVTVNQGSPFDPSPSKTNH